MKTLFYRRYIFHVFLLILTLIECSQITDPGENVQTKIVFVSDRFTYQDIYVMDSDGNNQLALTNNQGICSNPRFSHDGLRIVFQIDTTGTRLYPQIYIINIDGTELKQLTHGYINNGSPQFYPNDDKILFYSTKPQYIGESGIYSMNVDGTNQTRLLNPSAYPYFKFIPGDSRIVYSDDNDIYVMDGDGSNQTNLTLNEGHWESSEFDISRDGKKIVYIQANPQYDRDIFIMSITGAGKTQLTFSDHWSPGSPKFSPDGKKILFTERDYNRLRMIDIDGSNMVNLTENGLQLTALFDINSRDIYYSSTYGENSQIYTMNIYRKIPIRLTLISGANYPVDVYP